MPATTTTSPPQSPRPFHAPLRKDPLNLARTTYLAHTTRQKLSTAASRADHDLRVLVGHANFLDSLLLELAEAQRTQDRRPPPSPAAAPQRVVAEPKRRADGVDGGVASKPADDWEVWESDGSESDASDSESGEDVGEVGVATVTRVGPERLGAFLVVAREVGEDDDDEDHGDLALMRTLSHSPPRFLDDPFA